MPPKKKAAAKKKAGAKKKVAPKKKAVPKKKPVAKKKPATKKKTVAKKKAEPPKPVMVSKEPAIIEVEKKAEILTPVPETPVDRTPKEMVECSHCLGAGKCTAGEVFDKDRHQNLFQEQRLTSCHECLASAGESRNSKKLVPCRICGGTGLVEKSD
jgi:hypothetical protein